jgi:hypothetical protein
MKDDLHPIPPLELRKNLLTGAAAGAAMGLGLGFGFGSLALGLAVGTLAGLALGFRLGRLPSRMRFPMYMTRRMLLAGAFLILTSLGYMLLLDRGWKGARAILAASPAILAWAVLVLVIGSAIAGLDELQRRIQTEAIAIGFAGTAIAAGGYGLLGLAGIAPANWGFVPLVMTVMWLVGKLWTMWRYR